MKIEIPNEHLWLFLGVGLIFFAGLYDVEIGYWSLIPFILGITILMFLIDKPNEKED